MTLAGWQLRPAGLNPDTGKPFQWKRIGAAWAIANCTLEELGETWTMNYEFRPAEQKQ